LEHHLVTHSPIHRFAQSPLLLSYIGGSKGEALHLSIESSIGGVGGSWTSITNKNSYNIILTLWLGALKGMGGLHPKSSPSQLYRWTKGEGPPSFHRIFYWGELDFYHK
jgi:hypothetical protein